MSFPYAERDYSLYSSSTTEGSVGKAYHDLDRCARILNEVLDNGSGIIDGIKKRKSLSSPRKDGTTTQCKKVRQTNKVISTDKALVTNKVSSSTPFQTPLSQTRRKRTSSASSVCSSSKFHHHRRPRSLSEQRSCSVPTSRVGRNRTRSCSTHESVTRSRQFHNSAASVIANNSLTSSEADTLTGVHLDNSSQFGVPPVFSDRGQKDRRLPKLLSNKRSASTCHNNLGWLKPQASISTQTATSGKENQPDLKRKSRHKKKENKCRPNKQRSSSKADCVKIPSADLFATRERQSSSPQLDVESPSLITTKSFSGPAREHDVDDLLDRTLESQEVLTQVGMESVKSSSEGQTVAELLGRLRSAALTNDSSLLDNEMEKVSKIFNEMLERPSSSHTSIDKLLLPFQREAKELRQQVIELKRQLHEDKDSRLAQGASTDRKESDNSLARDLTVKVVAAEARNTQLSNQLTDLAAELAEERSKVFHLSQNRSVTASGDNQQFRPDLNPPSQLGCGRESSPQLNSVNHRLVALQTTTRLLHTRLSDVASRCDTKTSRELSAILELCARGLIQSMDSDDSAITQVNRNNNSKWANKPPNLAEVVSSNLIKTRASGGGCGDALAGSPSQPYRSYKAVGDCTRPKPLALATSDGESNTAHTFRPEYFDKSQNLIKDYQSSMSHKVAAGDGYSGAADTRNLHGIAVEDVDNQSMPNTLDPSAAHYLHAAEADLLHSTFKSHDSTLTEQDVSSPSTSSVSLGTTLADNAFQEGLAQLDANIAKLQASLKSSRFSSTT